MVGCEQALIPVKYPEDLISLVLFFCYLRLVLDMTHGSGVWRITDLFSDGLRPLFLYSCFSGAVRP